MNVPLYRLDQIEAKPLEWLWYPYLARGKYTLLEGDPGVGKSTVSLDLVARLSRGEAMPGEASGSGKPVRTLLLASDHDAAGLRERLQLAGADLSVVFVVVAPLKLNEDDALDAIELLIEREEIDLVIVDSLPAWLDRVRWRDENQVREALRPLIAVAQRQHFAVLVLMPSLPGRGRPIGTCGIFSVALEVVEHPRLFGSVLLFLRRSNIGPLRDPIAGRRFEPGDEELVKWTDLLDAEISKPLGPMTKAGANYEPPGMLAAAMAWLAAFMDGRTMPERAILAAGRGLGYRRNLLDRAKTQLGYPGEAEDIDGRREWVWIALPQRVG